jgi:hypothetical protein
LLLLLLFPLRALGQSALSTAATNLAPGTWTSFTTTNLNVLAQGGIDGNVLPFGFKGVWDPVSKKAYWLGGDHGCTANIVKQFSYDDATNSWSDQGNTPFQSCHGYDHLSIDPLNRVMYMWPYDSTFGTGLTIFKYNLATSGPWTTQSAPNFTTGTNVAHGSTWFSGPIAGEGANGAWMGYNCGSNGGEVVLLRASGTFAADITGFGGTGTYHCFAAYSKVFNVGIFGGGNANGPNVWRLNSNKTVTTMPNAPIGLGIQQAIVIPDPISGKFIVRGSGRLYSYDPRGTGTWVQLANPPTNTVGDPAVPEDVIGIPISTYGVIMWVTCRATTCRVDLYKPSTVNDFGLRCAAPGVVLCNGFDTASDIVGEYGDGKGTIPGSSFGTRPTISNAQAASGAGSMLMNIPANGGTDPSGSFFTRFDPVNAAPGLTFGANANFYIQWRQRIPSAAFTQAGWKQAIIGGADSVGCTAGTTAPCISSCSTVETVTQNTFNRGFLQMYNSCTGSASHGPFSPFEEPFGASDFKMQNNMPSPFCLYSNLPSTNGCFVYFNNEWMTFQVHIQTGPCVNGEFSNSHVDTWIAREGAVATKVFNWGPYNLSSTASCAMPFGKVWLLPYATNTWGSNPALQIFYDELVISTQQIADPGQASPPPPPAPIVSLSPTSLSFGSQNVGTTSTTRTTTLTNTGTATLTITSIGLTGTNPGDFNIVSNTCGTSLVQSASCVVGITFLPTAPASRSANLTFTTNAVSSPDNVALTGTGTSAGTPVVSLSSTSFNFGVLVVNLTSAAQTTTLTNTGTAILTITSISKTGTNPGDFNISSNTCGASLGVGANCVVGVTFKPVLSGSRSASLTFTTNAVSSPDNVALAGVGSLKTIIGAGTIFGSGKVNP